MQTKRSIYVASRVHHAWLWRELRAAGYPITATWIDESGEGETADMGELWARIREEITAATALVLYARADDFPLKGALIEAGMALAMGKPIFLVLDGVTLEEKSMRPVGSWILHSQVKRCPTLADAFAAAKC
jgi:hypothetical protein